MKHPTHKIALELVAKEGGFIITAKDNEKPATPRSKQPPSVADGAAPASTAEKPTAPAKLGAFTAQELLRKQKRAMKRKRSDPRISKKIADNPHE